MNKAAIQIRVIDQVATSITLLTPGDRVPIRGSETDLSIEVIESIPAGHKIALVDIKEGEHILKYGEVIGYATEDIAQGAHVHMHNCRGIKARRNVDAVTNELKGE